MNSEMAEYAELHCHSNYSFLEGASFVDELVSRANELRFSALALTDHNNLCGAMEFANAAKSIGLPGITGAEITLQGGFHITLLATSSLGYGNLCQLLSLAHVTNGRQNPELDFNLLSDHAAGLILLTGCSMGHVPSLLMKGQFDKAESLVKQYFEWFGEGNVYLELQRNFVQGDTQRIERLVTLSRKLGVPLVATNNVHYHIPERHRLQDCLVSISHRLTLEESHRERRANSEFYLKSPGEMVRLFRELPDAIRNTLEIAERCEFDLTRDRTYQLPDYPVTEGFTPLSYLAHLCEEAAARRYGHINKRVEARLRQEFRLIKRHNLAGFLLVYHDIIQIAREIQVDLGLVDRETPIEEAPPGRGRGSSVSMLVGYLIGLSHIDPLKYNISLDRFLPDQDLPSMPDIDLDFPRNVREELIKRIHRHWGWNHAALAGMIPRYLIKGVIRDLGHVLGLPRTELGALAKRVESAHANSLQSEIRAIPEFRTKIDAPAWQNLINLASQLDGFPKYLAQHPGGMIISSAPLSEQVPIQPGAIEGRYVCQWDKDSIDAAGFVKIDFLSLGALSQLQEAVKLIEHRTKHPCDLSRINFEDQVVYGMLARADTIGIFQVESAAQMQTITRLRPRSLVDMAHEVAAVRPGVGANNGVSEYLRRRTGQAPITFDHPLERPALERTLGVILFQDQVNQLAIDIAGFTSGQADRMRRIYQQHGKERLVTAYWEKFRAGATIRGIDAETAARVFSKFNAGYMFPESHAYAFGVTAYQASWLKCYYPLEFFVGLFNEQPMGFYNLETVKEDAKRHGVQVLHPDLNYSQERCVIENESIRMGLLHVRDVGPAVARAIVRERETHGLFPDLVNFVGRVSVPKAGLDYLAGAGALDSLAEVGAQGGRAIRWEVGLQYRRAGKQLPLPLPVIQDFVVLPQATEWERMEDAYESLGLYPNGHLMEHLRGYLPQALTSQQVWDQEEGKEVCLAGLVVRRQRPLGRAVFITLEDEFGHVPLVLRPSTYYRYRHVIRSPVLLVVGFVRRKEGTMLVELCKAESIDINSSLPTMPSWT